MTVPNPPPAGDPLPDGVRWPTGASRLRRTRSGGISAWAYGRWWRVADDFTNCLICGIRFARVVRGQLKVTTCSVSCSRILTAQRCAAKVGAANPSWRGGVWLNERARRNDAAQARHYLFAGLTNEEWRPVVGYEGVYSVSDCGRVRRDAPGGSSRPGRILTPSRKTNGGHLAVQLFRDGHFRTLAVHRAVLLAFVGEPRPGEECRHLNGDPTDNHLNNLRWGTRAENAADKRRHGTQPRKLTDADVREIRATYIRGSREFGLRALGEKYGVCGAVIWNALWRGWKHVA